MGGKFSIKEGNRTIYSSDNENARDEQFKKLQKAKRKVKTEDKKYIKEDK